MQKQKLTNVGILAHVDAGKTSLTEHFLYYAGVTRKRGSVDAGTTNSDFLDVERERGISVRSSFTTFEWNDTQINLIDTPGHVDFSTDVERVLGILDFAVLVVSAAEGVQSHTENIYSALKESGIPFMIFVNKIDRTGVEIDSLLNEIKMELTDNILILNSVENEGQNEASVSPISITRVYQDNIESIVTSDEAALEKYLEDYDFSAEELSKLAINSVQTNKISPLLFGSAKNDVGIEALLDNIVRFAPQANGDTDKPLSAMVHSVSFDKTMGKIANVRLFNGAILSRDTVKNVSLDIEEKVTQIMKIASSKFIDIGRVEAGDIAAISGMQNVRAGDILGDEIGGLRKPIKLNQPLLTLKAEPKNEADYPALAEALTQLSHEDPTLEFEQLKEERELHIKILGYIQLEVLETIIKQRYGLEVIFEKPSVIYKETPVAKVLGIVRYTMPKPCWSVMNFLIEPLERGSGVEYHSQMSVDKIKQRYQNETERTIPSALKQGIKGWEVTDLRITLVDGEDHEMHSRAGDFAVATPMGILNGLKEIGTKFLEPILSFKIIAPDEYLGAITSDIIQMRGSFEAPQQENGRFTLEGLVPLATSLEYSIRLSSKTADKAKIRTHFHSYKECADNLGVVRPYKGISPLDRSKWILKARRALQ